MTKKDYVTREELEAELNLDVIKILSVVYLLVVFSFIIYHTVFNNPSFTDLAEKEGWEEVCVEWENSFYDGCLENIDYSTAKVLISVCQERFGECRGVKIESCTNLNYCTENALRRKP